ncbi:MAG: efflux RND transporter periplasmic adaptor subunit [Candidatus Competibacteraceae bacterium]
MLFSALLIVVIPGFAAAQPVTVQAVALQQLAIHPETSAPATVVSLSDSRIGAELNAQVQDIPVRVGDVIEAGGVLARLDCTDYELAADELEARLKGTESRIDFARRQLQRADKLKQQRTVTQELLDERRSNLATLVAEREAERAGLARARRKLDQCVIRAPFQAVILQRLASVGEYVTPGSPLVRIMDVVQLEIAAPVLVGDTATLLSAERIVFRRGERDYPVRLRVLTPAIDELSRTREARLLFAADAALPGASGRLVWQASQAVPADLLVRRNGMLGLLLAQDGTARFQPLPEAQEGRPAAVQLPPDTLIITDGRFALNDGDPIALPD